MLFPGLDSQGSAFFEKQLEHIKATVLETEFPALKMLQHVPVSMEAPAGAESITQRIFTALGVAKIVTDYSDDLPQVDVDGDEVTVPVRTPADAFTYSLIEVENARMAGVNLNARKANSAREAIEQKIDAIALFGDASHGLFGMLTFPNFSKIDAPNGSWTYGTDADDILEDLNEIANYPEVISNGVEGNEDMTLLLPVTQFTVIASKKHSTLGNVSILSAFREMHPMITVDRYAKLAGVTPNPRTGSGTPTDVAVLFPRNPAKVSLEIPLLFTQLPPQPKNLGFTVPCYARTGGVLSAKPLSVAVMDGI
jgi:hypothetical protein